MEGYKNRKLAKEWLIFVCCFVPSVIFFTCLVFYFKGKTDLSFLEALLFIKWKDNFVVWLVALSPYILVQFIRTIVWSIKTWKAPKTELPRTDRKPMDFKVWFLDSANVLIITVAILLAVIIYCFSTRFQIVTTNGQHHVFAYVLDRMAGTVEPLGD